MYKRTHYTPDEVTSFIFSRWPNMSAMTLIKIKQRNNINATYAGTTKLYSVAEFERYMNAIESTALVEQNGFLIIKEEES